MATTASTIAQQPAQITSHLTERLAAVEKANYEGQGKSTVNDPMMAQVMSELRPELKVVREVTSRGEGRSEISMPLMMAIVAAVAGALVYLMRI